MTKMLTILPAKFNPNLYEKSTFLTKEDFGNGYSKWLFEELRRNLKLSKDGVGLAAPQLGINKRAFVMRWAGQFYYCANPMWTGDTMSTNGDPITEFKKEGCLSFIGKQVEKERYYHILAAYENPDGTVNCVEKNMYGMLARIFQHETDHLDGVCIV